MGEGKKKEYFFVKLTEIKKMKIYNIIDEQGRFREYKATTETGKQQDSHTFSYVYSRHQFQDVGIKMGLELELNKLIKK